jgi:putative transcriptional regulator
MSAPEKFLKGQLLLDSGQLRGSFFQRTVVLICEHNAEGAFGLVLNRSTGSKIGEMVVADLPETLKEFPLYLGGPVQPTALSYLHSDSFIPEVDKSFLTTDAPNGTVIPNLALGHSLDTLVEIGESFSPTRKVKMFAGYSGWGPGQLEDEMKRKAWLTYPASLELVLETDPSVLWQKVLRSMGPKYTLLSQMPEDLSLN